MSLFRRLVRIRWGILLEGIGIAFYTIPVSADPSRDIWGEVLGGGRERDIAKLNP
jgi:hypothetical protein